MVALVVGAAALGLAAMTTVAYGVPPPWHVKPPVVEGQKSIEFKGARFAWGGKAARVQEPTAPDTPRLLLTGSAAVAVAGLTTAGLARWRERTSVLAGPAVALCAAALAWQYVLIGVLIGVSAAVFLWVASKLSA